MAFVYMRFWVAGCFSRLSMLITQIVFVIHMRTDAPAQG